MMCSRHSPARHLTSVVVLTKLALAFRGGWQSGMKCVHCGTENVEGRRFCGECGGLLARPCGICSFLNEPTERFCGGCGRPLGGAESRDRAVVLPFPTPKHLTARILASPSAREGERKQVTVLFADMKDSMQLLADRDPEEARQILDPVLQSMMEAVHRYEGMVNQVMGDGIMALFGAPVANEDHAVRACYAALRMQESVGRYAEQVHGTAEVTISIRVGLNAGEVVVRSIGSDLHMDYTAVGQTTHLAARMEQAARPGSVLLTHEVLRLAEDHVHVKPLGPMNIKGLAAPVTVYELIGASSVRSRLHAVSRRGLTPFVGRRGEVDALHQALDQAAAGRGRVVALVGDSGVGKSRLCYELAQSPRTEGWLILQGAAASYGRSIPYLPVVEFLRTCFEIEEWDDAAKIREKVTTALVVRHRALAPMAPAFLGLFNIRVADPDWNALDPSQVRWKTLDAVRRLLIGGSQARPLLLVLEDLQWVDSETQALLSSLIASIPTARLLLLITYRPEYHDLCASRTGYSQLHVDPLPPAAAREMLDALLGNGISVKSLKELLIGQTQGNPLFIEESVAALVETKVLLGERGDYHVDKALDTVKVPSTVHAVLAARIDRLPPDEKRLLQCASVIGSEVPFSLLSAIAELPEETLREYLTTLETAELLYETELFPDLVYRFKHVLTQDVTYASVLHERRRNLHGRIVEAFERLFPERLQEQVEWLAHHAVHGEAWERAVRYCRQAGTKAAARSANQEAVECFRRALNFLDHFPETRATLELAIDLRLEMRPVLLQLGRLEEILEISREAESIAQRLGDEQRLARVYVYLINYHHLKGEPLPAMKYGEKCLAMTVRTGDRALQSLAERYMGHIYHTLGSYRSAAEVFQRHIEALGAKEERSTDETIAYVASGAWRAFALAELGEFQSAHDQIEIARVAAERSRHAYSQAIAATLGGLVLMRQGQLERAVPSLEQALDLCTQNGLAVWRPIPASVLGLTLARLGRKDEGLRLLEAGVHLTEELGLSAYLALWTEHLAAGLLFSGQVETAAPVAARALELACHHGERGHQAWALRLLGDLALHRSPADLETAKSSYGEARGLASECGMRPLVAHCDLGLGRVFRLTSDRVNAERCLTSAAAAFWEMGMYRELQRAEI